MNIKYIDATTADFLAAGDIVFTKDRGLAGDVLSPGDLGQFELTLPAAITPRDTATIQFIPETGTMVIKDIVAPSTFGTQLQVQLFP
jgi:archaellin